MRPLDFVITPKGQFAIIEHVQTTQGIVNASIEFIGINKEYEKIAWYSEDELEIIDNLPHVLTAALYRRSSGSGDVDRFYPMIEKIQNSSTEGPHASSWRL